MMKRVFICLCSVVVLLSLGAVTTAASEIFEPAGDVEIAWLTEDQVDTIEFDGSLDEWSNFDLTAKKLDYTNMITWHVDDQPGRFDEPDAIGPDFAINTYFAADSDYLYVAFYIEDDVFAYSDNNAGSYNGDAFQISIDWNRHMENAPALGAYYQNNKNVFYSFSCAGDGEPLTIRIQEGFKDRDISEATSVDPEKPDMKGSAGATDNGWCVEFALSWQLLYSDFEYKTWESPVDLFDATHPVSLGMSICYLNRDETNGPITWAAGTFDNDTEYPTWEPTYNGLYATLNWEQGRYLNCSGINSSPCYWSEWEEVTTPTCTIEGTEERFCYHCGEVQTQGIPARGHSYDGWVVKKKPTCTVDGVKTRTCGNCDAEEVMVTYAEGHKVGDPITVSDPTCTENGVRYLPCMECDTVLLNEFTPATGHKFGQWRVIEEATENMEGFKVRTCFCGAEDREIIPAFGDDTEESSVETSAVSEETEDSIDTTDTIDTKINNVMSTGCGGVIGSTGALMMAVVGAAVLVVKKKEN